MSETITASRLHHLIAGDPSATDGRTGPVYDPATGEQTGQLPYASPATVDQAVASSSAAWGRWASVPLLQRANTMFAIRDVVTSHREELARLIVAENGKTLADALGEISRGIEALEFACGVPQILEGRFSSNAATGIDVHSIRQPVGVVAGITPFNFPIMVPLWMISNAIASGNAFVLKPSEKAPSAPVRLAELLLDAGLPASVLNVVHGDAETVAALITHPGIAAVSFVGSTPIARQVYVTATAAGKRVQALGGAKNHMIVLPDADLPDAIAAAVSAGYGTAGERCMAVSVVVPVGDVADDLVAGINQAAGQIEVGSGFDTGVQMGPLVTRAHRDRVASYIDNSSSQGATVVRDGRADRCFNSDGFFLGPSLVDHVRPEMSVYKDEVFGPLLSVVRSGTVDDAITLVNSNPYGNGAALFTRSGSAARRFELETNIGMIGINVPIPVPAAWSSFGGWKSSLFGDSHMYGPEGIHFYTRQKVITSRWPAATSYEPR